MPMFHDFKSRVPPDKSGKHLQMKNPADRFKRVAPSGKAQLEGTIMAMHPGLDEENLGDEEVHEKLDTAVILCYLICPKDAAGGFTGAILLTDNRARPQHFAYVQPVKPTKMQSILYGLTLDEYLKVDVIAYKLWQGLPKRPDVLFVNTPDLIATRRITGIPTAFIAKLP